MSNDDAKTGLELMEARMLDLESRLLAPRRDQSKRSPSIASTPTSGRRGGWPLIEKSKWKPCPIGAVLPLGGAGRMSTLDLVRA